MKQHKILLIEPTKPFDLFQSKDEESLKKEYKRLCSQYHPDKHINDFELYNRIFSHLTVLYEKACKDIQIKTLGLKKIFISHDNKEFELSYKKLHTLEFAQLYISSSLIAYEIKKNNCDLVENFLQFSIFEKMNISKDSMKKEFKKYIPELIQKIDLPNGDILIILKRMKNTISLQDLLIKEQKIDSRDVAWIVSSMFNLACFFQHIGIVSCGFSLSNYFIEPQQHLGILSHYFYTKKIDDKLLALDKNIFNLLTDDFLKEKRAKTLIDLESIKLIGRQLLGDGTGVHLRHDTTIPKEMINFLMQPSSGNAFEDYKVWHNDILIKCFGARKYHEMKIHFDDIY